MVSNGKKAAYIFPGQASQYVGMGHELHEKYEAVRRLYSDAEEILGFNLSEVSFHGPIEELTKTIVTQPAIFTHSAALLSILREEGWTASFAAGHSLGEYSAYLAADSLSFADACELVRVRASAMQAACEANPGTMAAIIGLEPGILDEVCTIASRKGIVTIANLNSPAQLVISGEIAAVEEAMNIAKERGAKITKRLNVGGAFHSPLMESAQNDLEIALNETEFTPPSFPVYSNVTASTISNPEEIKNSLKKQLISPVCWYPSIQNMAMAGAEIFFEIGPGKVLSGLNRRISSELISKSVDKVTDIDEILA